MIMIHIIACGVCNTAKLFIKRLTPSYAVDLLSSVHIYNCFQQRDKKIIRFDIAPTRDFGCEQLVYKHSFCYNLFFGLFSYQLVMEKRICPMVYIRVKKKKKKLNPVFDFISDDGNNNNNKSYV